MAVKILLAEDMLNTCNLLFLFSLIHSILTKRTWLFVIHVFFFYFFE